MRPIELTIRAFGPYAESETIDFRELGDAKMFVISGKTGSGKTSIFDALSFALFGKANTEDRDSLSLRSHYASEDITTEVGLTFTIKGKTYIVIRQPQQEIPKKNGEGMRIVGATASLHAYDNNQDELLASNVRDVDQKMSEILQLTVDQFRQILMIPQGAFRELLIAPSKDKQVILQKLANTVVYSKMEELLKEEQKEQELGMKLLSGEVEQSLNTTFLPEEIEGKNALEVHSLFEGRITDAKIALKSAYEFSSIIKIKVENATKDVALSESRAIDWDKLDNLGKEIQALAGQEPEIEVKKQTILRAKRAENLRTQEILCGDAQARKQEVEANIIEIQKRIRSLREELEDVTQNRNRFAENIPMQEKREQEIFKLSELEVKIERLARNEKDLIAYENEMKLIMSALDILRNNVKEIEARKTNFSDEEKKLQTTKIRQKELENIVLQLENEYVTNQNMLENQELKEKNTALLLIMREKLKEVSTNYDTALATLKRIEHQIKNEQAASLATGLEDGVPCPVCGAHHHPRLAIQLGEGVDNLLQQAKADLENKKNLKQEEELAVEKVLWILEQAPNTPLVNVAQLSGRLQKIQADIQTYKAELVMATKMITKEDGLSKNIAWINKEIFELNIKIQEEDSKLQAIKAPAQQVLALVEMLKKEIPTEFTNSAVYYRKLRAKQAEAAVFEKDYQALEGNYFDKRENVANAETEFNSMQVSLQKVREQLEHNLNVFDKMLLQFEFDSHDAYKNAARSASEIEILEQACQEFQQQKFYCIQTEQELQRKLAGLDKPDVGTLKIKLAALQNEQFENEKAVFTITENQGRIESNFAQYLKLFAKIKDAEKLYADLGELAQSANGKNERNVGFERYVLAAFLDSILERANTRLAQMTEGRFYLERKQEKAKHNAQSGLDLSIYDEYTGRMRDVTTLSGGESFKTSLALALALAEVVQEMSGGISLETMFIDEGFGTLDSESLESAVECLLQTQQGGRLVGVISHVPELKERIGAHLEVMATNRGSKTVFKC